MYISMWHFIIQCSQLLSHISHINRIGDASHPGKSWAPKEITATAIISIIWKHQWVEYTIPFYTTYHSYMSFPIINHYLLRNKQEGSWLFWCYVYRQILVSLFLGDIVISAWSVCETCSISSHVFLINKICTRRDFNW